MEKPFNNWITKKQFFGKVLKVLQKLHYVKNEVLHWGFLQQMWPNLQFPVDMVTDFFVQYYKNIPKLYVSIPNKKSILSSISFSI